MLHVKPKQAASGPSGSRALLFPDSFVAVSAPLVPYPQKQGGMLAVGMSGEVPRTSEDAHPMSQCTSASLSCTPLQNTPVCAERQHLTLQWSSDVSSPTRAPTPVKLCFEKHRHPDDWVLQHPTPGHELKNSSGFR
jgi:hypothetical protein